MLKLCPECCLQVSDKAAACPHCGYPLKSKSSLPPKKKKHMRLPNGFGQISEVRGRNLRKPFGQWSQPEELMKANRSYARSVRSLILKRIMKHMKRL